MKKATTIVLLALCFAAQTAVAQCPGTWQPVSSGLSTELRALHFPTNQDGWAVGAAGKIIRSTDGGLTWGAAQTSGTAATLNGVHFVSASTGWAVGHRGIILKTSNGGGAWTPQASNTETDLFDVWFTDAQNGWVVGACGLILRTTDGGQQWAQVSSGKDYNIRQVKVLPNGKGFTTTTGAALIATANSGANWTGQTTAPRNFRGMDLDAGGLAFAASKDGQLLKSTDHGSTWANATAPAGGGNWEALYMASATHIVLAGQNGQVFRSTDGGTSWVDFRTGLDSSDIFGLQMSGDTLGWAVGEGGKVFRFVCTALLPDMVPVPGGTFEMGCFKPNTICDPKENPVHVVTLPNFQIGKYEVTQAEWEAIMGDISPDSIPFAMNCGGTCPMEKITWYGAAVYCNRRSEQNGLAPCYYADTAFAQVFGKNGSTWSLPNSGTVHWKKDADGYRLPTEAEWEYAARGGTQSQGYRYAGGNGPNGVAWHRTISSGKPHPVGQKTPNEVGLYDMSGNVWELCWDWYAAYFGAAACSPIGPSTGTKRLSRGGSFDNLEDLARVSYRPFFPEPDRPVFDIGFRLAQGKVLPNCTNVLVQPAHAATNVSTNTGLRWASSNVCVSGYRLSIGTAPGGSDILNNVVVADTFYQPALPLPAGDTVYVRVVPFNGAGEASGCGEFGFVTQNLAQTCPPPGYPAPGDLCPDAPLICQGLNGYCNTLGSDNVPSIFPSCPGFQISDPSWLAFIAGSTQITLRITPSNCSGGNQIGMQAGIYAACIAQPMDLQCACTTNPFLLSAGTFVIGQKYYLVVDGCVGATCDYSIEVLSGSTSTPICVDTLSIPGHQTTNVATNTSLGWSAAPGAGCVSGYRLSLSTTPGGSDLLNNQTITDTFYQPAQPLPAGDTVFVRIVPFNGAGAASGCGEFWFVTADEVISDTIPPCAVWQKVLGGTFNESGSAVVPTQDGGYIVAGGAFSIDGDVSGNHGGSDAWVIKLDSAGAIQWKRAYGGAQDEEAFDIEATPEGGYIFTGYAMSKDGDVSKNQGGRDVWVVKTDATGNIQWQKNYGGEADETASSIATTSDGGYLVAGTTLSLNGDVSGHHGAYDGWVFKIDQSGNLQWQRPLGGSSNDYINSPQVTPDGGYILAGFTLSNNGDVTGNHGGGDAWMVKLTSNGVLAWQKAFGGSGFDDFQSIVVNTDGTYVAAGFTSSNDGDVSGNHGDRDVWMVKASATGLLLWQHCFGGSLIDAASEIQHTSDQGYIISAGTASTNGNVTGHHSATDAWVVKTTSSGKLQWQKCLGGTGQENAHHVVQHTDGDYSMVGYTDSNDGDVSGNHGLRDLWVVKLSQINASASPDTTLCSNSPLTLTASGGLSYQWSDGGPATAQWTLTPTATQTYTVTVTAADGCTAVDSVKVTIQSDLNCGLVAHYNFDGNARDTSGNNNHGIPTGIFDYSKDRFGDCGQAIHLNGFYQKGWVRVPNSNSLKFNDKKQMTLSLWVALDDLAGMNGNSQYASNGYHMLIAKGGDNTGLTPGGFFYGLFTGNSNLSAYGSNSGASMNMDLNVPIHPNYQLNLWKHIVLVATPDSVRLYVDGGIIYQALSNTNFTDSDTKDLLLGIMDGRNGPPFWYPLKGSIDDLRLYARALSPTEITQLYTLPNDNPSIPPASLASSAQTTLCPGETTALTAAPAQAGYTYAWYRDSTLIAGAAGSTYAAAQPGHYQVRITATTGCDSLSAPVQITSAAPNISALGDTLTCTSPIALLQANSTTPGATYSWTGPNGFSTTQQNPPVNVAGTYILTVNDPASTCFVRDTVEVMAANGLPSAVIAAPNGTLLTCTTDSVWLSATTGAGYMYAWTGPGGFTANGQQSTIYIPGTYTLTITNSANGCSATSSVIIEKNAASPDIAAVGGELPCKTPFVVLNGQSGTPGVTYSWAGPNGFAVNQQNPPVSVAGTYTLTVRNPVNGCTATATAVVEPPQLPVAAITAVNGAEVSCSKPSVILQLPAGAGYTYRWQGPGGFTIGFEASKEFLVAGVYTVTVTNQQTGCSSTGSITVAYNKVAPSASAAGGLLTCTQSSVLLQGNSATPGALYAWAGPNGFTNSQQKPPVNAVGTYVLTVTNPANGCTSTAWAQVLEDKTIPTAAATAPAGNLLTCAKTSIVLQAATASGETYAWAGPGGFMAAGQQATISNSGIYILTVRNTASGCTDTAAVAITQEIDKPDISATGGTLTCTQLVVVLNGASSTPGATYAWVGPGGFASGLPGPAVNVGGTYRLTVSNPVNGCTSTAIASVNLNQASPNASATNATLTCAQPSATISANSSTPGVQYAWAGPAGFMFSGQQPTVSAPGIYTVTVTNPANGCIGTTTTTIAQNITFPTAAINTPSGTALNCLVSGVALQASGGGTYLWSGGLGNGPNIVVAQQGTYTVVVTDPANGCTAFATTVVSENKTLPDLTATGGPLSCAQQQATLQASSSVAGATFKWVGPGGFTVSGQQPTVNVSGNYTCTATDPSNGCTATQQVMVAPALVLTPVIAPVKKLCVGESVVLKASTGFANYKWSNGPFAGDSSVVNQAGTYFVTVTDSNQCVGTASMTVTSADPVVPMIQGNPAFCTGGSVTVNADLTFDAYLWSNTKKSPGITVNVSGVYTVTVTNAEGCTGTSSVTIKEHPAALALLLVSEDTVCAGDVVTFTAGGGAQYLFWLDGVAQGTFSSNKTLVLNGPTDGSTVTVQIIDGNTCRDSTVAGDGPGREPIALSVQPNPNLSGAFMTPLPSCPEDSVRLLLNLPKLSNGLYTIYWRIDNQAPVSASVFLFNQLGTLVLPPLPPGPHICQMQGMELLGTGCLADWPANNNSLNINVPQPAKTTLDRTICYTQSVQVGGKTYNQSGTYTDVLTSATGCDSTVVLKLKVVMEFEEQRVATICSGETYVFYDTTITAGGFYNKKVAGTQGCDSLIQLVLTIESPVYNFISKSVCPGSSYQVGDSIFSQPGTYQVPFKSQISGCDSIVVFTLKWPLSPLSASFSSDSIRICKDETLPLAPTVQNCTNCKYKWSGGATLPSIFVAPTTDTSYSVTVTDAATNCTAVATVMVLVIQPVFSTRDTLLCPGEALDWCGKSISKPGEYPCTFQTPEGCDSTVTLNVQVFDGQFETVEDSLSVALGVLEQKYNVQEKLLQNDSYSGGYDIQIVRQPRLDSVRLEDNGQTLHYILKAGTRFGTDTFYYALCPPNGCPAACDSAWVVVRLQNGDLKWVEEHMPNLITPGGSKGENDVFDPLGFAQNKGSVYPELSTVRLYIYNRWGEVVHHPNPYEVWDGTQGRVDLPQATYYYLFRFEIGGTLYQLRGAVNLLR